MKLMPPHAPSDTSAERVRPSCTHPLEELLPLHLELSRSDESDLITLIQPAHDLRAVPVGQADHHHAKLNASALPDHEHDSTLRRPCRSTRMLTLPVLTASKSAPSRISPLRPGRPNGIRNEFCETSPPLSLANMLPTRPPPANIPSISTPQRLRRSTPRSGRVETITLVPQDASAPGTTNGCRSNIASGTAGGGTSLRRRRDRFEERRHPCPTQPFRLVGDAGVTSPP
jgi:hypothetical protein